MDRIDHTSWGDTDTLQLKVDTKDSELDQQLQKDAYKGICHDIVLMGQCDLDNGPQLPVWPLVAVERESPKAAVVGKTPKRSSWIGRRKTSKSSASTPSSTIDIETVDLVFVEQDRDTCLQAIEVCPSPSNKITDLQALQQQQTQTA